MQGTPEKWVWSLGQEDALEEGIATHSSILAGRISWIEEPGGLQSKNDWACMYENFPKFLLCQKVFLNEQNYAEHVDYHLSKLLRVTCSWNCVSCKLRFQLLRMSQSNWEGRCVHIFLAEQEHPNARIYRVAQCRGCILDCKNLRDWGSSPDSPTSPWLDIAETPFSLLRHGYYNTYNTGLCWTS